MDADSPTSSPEPAKPSDRAAPSRTHTGADLPRGLDDLEAAFAALPSRPPTVEHAPAYTVDDARELRGTIDGLHTKNLFVKDKKGALFLITVPEEALVDLKTIHTVIGAKGRVSFASADLMARHLGVAPGSVTPLAILNDGERAVTMVLDDAVANAATVNVHPLRNTATTTLPRDDFMTILRRWGREPLIVVVPRAR